MNKINKKIWIQFAIVKSKIPEAEINNIVIIWNKLFAMLGLSISLIAIIISYL